MSTITVSIPEGLEEALATRVVAEGHTSVGRYVAALIQRDLAAGERAALESKLLAGVESLDRGEGREMTATDWERLRANMSRRHPQG